MLLAAEFSVSKPEPATVIFPAKVLSAELAPVTVSASVSIAESMTRSTAPPIVAAKFDSDTLAVSVDPDATLFA
jgi:hypothetical protein